MKYRARFTIDREVSLDASSVAEAVAFLRKKLVGEDACILGVIPVGEEWPDAGRPQHPPPRNTPPSGSPGTPTLDAQPEPAQAVAA